MKRSAFIIIGVVLVLVLVAIWVYVLFFSGSPENGDRFANFGFGDDGNTSVPAPTPEPEPERPVVDVSDTEQRLRQLTSNPTIGFQEVISSASGSTPYLLYAEAGSGHVYSIDLETGEEERLSGTTIPQSNQAAFTPDGQHVMMRTGYGETSELVVGSISGTSTDLSNVTVIDTGVLDFNAVLENEFLYSVQTGDSVVAKRYDPVAGSAVDLFTIPFREASVYWSESAVGTHYVYPKSSSRLPGFALAARNGTLTRLPVDGDGLSAIGNEGYTIYSTVEEGEYRTRILDRTEGVSVPAPFQIIPEKCIDSLQRPGDLVCAQTFGDYGADMPDAWYRGDVSYHDSLWSIQAEAGVGTLLIDTFAETGRELDIIDLTFNANEENIYFINKYDRTLWLFVRSVALPIEPEESETE